MNRIDENHSFNINVAEVLNGHIQKAILLKEIYGWVFQNLAKGNNIRAGVAWTYNSAASYASKFKYMKSKSISKWLRELEADGWIISHNFNKFAYDRTKWYTINHNRYDDAVLSKEQSIATVEEWKLTMAKCIATEEESNDIKEQPIPSLTTSSKTSLTTSNEGIIIEDEVEQTILSKQEEEKKKKIAPKKKKELVFVYPECFSPNLIHHCNEFFEYRKEAKKSFKSQRGVNGKIKEFLLHLQEYGEEAVIQSINNAIANGYQGTFIPKEYQNKTKNNNNVKTNGNTWKERQTDLVNRVKENLNNSEFDW